MNFFKAMILGTVQGLTEFLPISSSGHLVIFQHFLGIYSENIAFEVVVHLGTLLSIIVVYYQDLKHMIVAFFNGITHRKIAVRYRTDSYFRLSILVILGTIPAALAGFLFEDFLISIFHNVRLAGVTLLITGIVIFGTHWRKENQHPITAGKSLLIGLAQAIAILPGISRSGFTISCALYFGIGRNEAARFSFLLAIPAIAGAALLHLIELFSGHITDVSTAALLTGFAFSFVVGYIAIRLLLSVLQSGYFKYFAPYCLVAGIIVLIFLH
jgi:undecaprenyl-diphosphatase